MRTKESKMGWFYTKKKSAEWKQECILQEQTIDTAASLSPTLHLLVILGIVLSLLWLSQYTTYKAQQNHTAIYIQSFLFLSPFMFGFFLLSYYTCRRLNFCCMHSRHESFHRVVVSPSKLERTHLAATAATAITLLLIFILF